MVLPHEQSATSGVTPVESAPLTPGASSQKQSAMMYREQANQSQNSMNKTGGKKRRYKGKGGSSTVVPSFPQSGPPTGSSSQSATGNSVSSNLTGTQSNADKACDKCFGDNVQPICNTPQCNPQAGGGGGCGCNSGTNGLVSIGQTWGCMSGGKRRRTQNRRSRRKKGGMEAVRSAANWVFAPAKQMYNDVTGETERKKQEDHFRRQSDKLDAQFEEDRKQDYLKRSKMLGNKVDLEGYKKQREDNDRMKEENRTHQSQEKISKRGGGKRTYRKSRKGKKSTKVKKSKKAKKSRKSRK